MTVAEVFETNPPGPAGGIKALIIDYAGVLTNPLAGIYNNFARTCGLTVEEIARVMARAAIEHGKSPLDLLESAGITEAEFLDVMQSAADREFAGRRIDLSGFRTMWFAGIKSNTPLLEFLDSIHALGYRIGLLTNNVKEWREDWIATIPLELFEVIVDSSEEHIRKPDEEIFHRTLSRLSLEPAECLLIDDVWDHCAAARRIGMQVVWFQSTPQAIYETGQALGL